VAEQKLTASVRRTLRDVAEAAGASITQASRALNGHDDVSEKTRARVLSAAARIGYSPNLQARRLKKPGTPVNAIGVVLATRSQRLSDPFLGELLTSLVDEAARLGYELQLSTPLADEDPIVSYQRSVRDGRVDGFVVLRAEIDDPRVSYLCDSGIPFVSFGRPDSGSPRSYPAVNESLDCMRPAVDHLVALGHRRIGCLAEPLEYAVAGQRLASFDHAIAAHAGKVAATRCVADGFREDAGEHAAGELLDAPAAPTALIAFNDLLAIGALRAAELRCIRVPGELSVIGFDDIHAAALTSPPLTTLRHHEQEVGRRLIGRLHAAIADRADTADVDLMPELVIRCSTGPAPPGSA